MEVESVSSVMVMACCDGDQQEALPGSGQRHERAPWEGACEAIVPSCSSARWPPACKFG